MRPTPVLAIFLTYDDCLEIETLRSIRKLGVYCVCYHVDMVGQWYRILRTGPQFDLVACAQKINITSLRHYRIRAEFIPMATYPRPMPAVAVAERVVGYTGAPQPYRLWFLSRLSKFFPVACYGRWFADETDGDEGQVAFVPDESVSHVEPTIPGKIAKVCFDLRYVIPVIQYSRYLLAGKWYCHARPPYPRVSKAELKSVWRGSLSEEELPLPFTKLLLNLGFTYYQGVPEGSTEIR